MNNHVFRPFAAVLVLFAFFLGVRHFIVPSDFGTHEKGFMYGYHRKGSEKEWKDFPLKYKSKQYCQECHEEQYANNMSSPHKIIECENCHGPAMDHPDNPEKLTIDRSRSLCLRCHSRLSYPGNQRSTIKNIVSGEHNPEYECASCHDPHHPNMED